ncbi:MAG: ribosome biogenesis GTP-binding protein YsxC [Candidatus Omnitrophica bacterium]|nr:ribosome biogenesis GTP-binding protein YsxC [Candidatus Omnitrophota bacterium]
MLRTTRHLMTEVDPEKVDESDAEVCFVGRSNAGKSTLINALCEKANLAWVSQVPGKTRTINVYEVKPYRWMVDLPGYGYAVGSKSDKSQLGPMIEGYLNSRENLRMVYVICDAVAGPTKLDILMINWLIHHEYPFRIIINKIDKIGSSKLEARKKEIAGQLDIGISDIYWISSQKNTGIEDLRKSIVRLLNDRSMDPVPSA